MSYTIKYITRADIDVRRWNDCIATASNGLVYAYVHFLDCTGEQWAALVLDDYKVVMPLIWRQKWGIKYLYQPYFIQQLGIMGNDITPALTDAFLQAIPAKYKYWDICLHENNMPSLFSHNCYDRVNMLLSLQQPYEKIKKQYHHSVHRMIRKALQHNVVIDDAGDLNEAITFFIGEYIQKMQLDNKATALLSRLLHTANEHKQLLYAVARVNEKLVAVQLLIADAQNSFLTVIGSSAEGKDCGASFLLLDHIIQKAIGLSNTLRFEGSDIEGIAAFNQKFGAQSITYPHLLVNRLPWFMKWLKK